jgi:hypothetical protein
MLSTTRSSLAMTLFAAILRGLPLVPAFILSSALSPFAVGQQPQPLAGSITDSSQLGKTQPPDVTLNSESKASDAAGIHRYSEQLIRLLVPERAGQKYIQSLTDRLATAEELARAGKGNLVPEAKVAQAYNNLMRQSGAPSPLYSDEAVVHRIRRFWLVADSSLDTVSAHPNDCNPGEAVYLLVSLLWNNGGPREDPPSRPALGGGTKPPPTRWVSVQPITGPQAGILLSSYSAKHSPHAVAAVFDSSAKTLGF